MREPLPVPRPRRRFAGSPFRLLPLRLLAVGYSHEASYPLSTPPACAKNEWNIKNHAKLASVRIAISPCPKILSAGLPLARRFGSEVRGSWAPHVEP